MTNGIGIIAMQVKARQFGRNIARAGTAIEASVFEIITISNGYVLVLMPQYSIAVLELKIFLLFSFTY